MQKTYQHTSSSKTKILESTPQKNHDHNENNYKQAIVFDIELLNGKQTSVTTICNISEIDFEEIVSYMSDAFKKAEKIKAITPSVGSISRGEYEPIFFYDRTEFDRSEVLNNPILRRVYGL